MATAAAQASAERENLQVLQPFLEVLRSSQEIKIPTETLSGAIGHFVGSLEGNRLDSFIQDILSSPSIWLVLDYNAMEAAVRPAPPSKVTSLRVHVKDGWIFRNRLEKACQAWLTEVYSSITRSGMTPKSMALLIGLLQGLDDVADVEWGKPRVVLEEALVIALSDLFETDSEDAVELFCSAAESINSARLRAMDLRLVVPRLHTELFTALGFPSSSMPGTGSPQALTSKRAGIVSRGLGRVISALSEGSARNQQYAWEELEAFVRRMYADCATTLQEEFGDYEPRKGADEWERHKAALDAFTTVAWPSVAIMLDPHRHPSTRQATELSALNILTLAKFASYTQSEGTTEGYEKLLYGSLDVISTEGGPRAVRSLIDALLKEKRTLQLAGFVLLIAEQLINLLDAATVRDKIVPLAAEYFTRPEDRSAFESSNAFLLVLLEVASAGLERDASQGPFVQSMVRICSNGLLKEAREGAVTTDQLLPAYTAVIRAASRYDTELVHECIDRLKSVTFDTQAYTQTANKILIAIIPSIPQAEMAAYLDSVAWIILNAPQGSNARTELAAHAFKVIMNDIPDESKQEGIEWWLKHRRVFQVQKEGRAKL